MSRPVAFPLPRAEAASGVSVADGVESVAETLKMARERREMTATKLAAKLGKSVSYISRAESDVDPFVITGQGLIDYAQALEVPVDLLTRRVHREPPEGTHFRSNKVSLRTRNRVEVEANFMADAANRMLRSGLIDPTFPWELPTLDVDEHGSPEVVAQILRDHWRLGSGPIKDMAGVLESTGVFVLQMPADIKGVDAITVRTPGPATAITLLAMDRPHDRLRSTLAHELGHLVIESATPIAFKDNEKRMDRFAAEFLIPYAEIRDDLVDIAPSQLDTVLNLHRAWGVHPASLIRRAFEHGDITQQRYHYWFRMLNARGINHGPLASSYPVEPRSAGDLAAVLSEEGLAPLQLANCAGQSERDLVATFGDAWPGKGLSLVR